MKSTEGGGAWRTWDTWTVTSLLVIYRDEL